MRFALTLLLAFAVLAAAAWLRPPEYDEAYSIFLTAGDARPAWPAGVLTPEAVRGFYRGAPGPIAIARALRQGDVHPPLYFWALEYWRRVAGAGWWQARLLSVLFGVAALACLGQVARLTGVPVAAAMLLALGCYGFAYTAVVARGFALAQLFNLLGVLAALHARRRPSRNAALAAGIAFGAAGLTNYLAVFVGAALLFWLALRAGRRVLLPAILGFAVFLPPMLSFFLAQRDSRIGQFQPFSLPRAGALLAKDLGAALFGGLPVYAGAAGPLITLLLAGLALLCAAFAVRNWRPQLEPFALAFAAMPLGLLLLGVIFHNTPIEIRYLGFAMPFAALIIGATAPAGLRWLLLGVQACALAGLMLAPATMQPQGLAVRAVARLDRPGALVLLPFGNDGVGIPGPFIAEAPDHWRLQLVRPGRLPDLTNESQVLLVAIAIDNSSKLTTPLLRARLRSDPCWRQVLATPLVEGFSRSCR